LTANTYYRIASANSGEAFSASFSVVAEDFGIHQTLNFHCSYNYGSDFSFTLINNSVYLSNIGIKNIRLRRNSSNIYADNYLEFEIGFPMGGGKCKIYMSNNFKSGGLTLLNFTTPVISAENITYTTVINNNMFSIVRDSVSRFEVTGSSVNIGGSANISGQLTTQTASIGIYDTNNTGFAQFSHINFKNDASKYCLLQASNGATFLNSASGQPIFFRNNNEATMTIASNSNVGIGTTSPTAKLDVVGTANISGFTRIQQSAPRFANASSSGVLHIVGQSIGSRNTNGSQSILVLEQPNTDDGSKGSKMSINLAFWENPGNNYPRTKVDFNLTGRTTDNTTTPKTVLSLYDSGSVNVSGTLTAQVASIGNTTGDNNFARFGHSIFVTNGSRYALKHQITGAVFINSSLNQPIEFRHDNSYRMRLLSNGNLTVTGTVTSSSDARLKENIEPLDESETHIKILQLQPKSYQRINRGKDDRIDIGLIAQEVKPIFPELVFEDDEGMMALCYDKVSILMLQSIKQLQKQIDELKNEIIQLKK